ncbi:DNA repair protein RadA [Lutispora saccharofermentans]|uniref:DNA repair protein RadA n=1 Tax=Lutispora saccharofermentans TaxID=3024236 RepID=A0ABT1NI90_9FIRM|nr:DNA repair protein RadA [Lutispora saccharofermentans]MCQ1530972.1 DNA repair protein RadA [Lutispora saccharofermentans]
MAKLKTKYVCMECGCESPKWMGKCPECNQWNTLVEEVDTKTAPASAPSLSNLSKPERMQDISIEEEMRLSTGLGELDRVLGGGIVKGSLILVGGDPGIGKSTLLLQLSDNIGKKGLKVLYVSGEESVKQIKIRAHRMSADSANIYLQSENNMDYIQRTIEDVNPDVLIIDSIQTVYNSSILSAPGSVSQVRDATGNLMRIAKGQGIAVFIVGHVTKAGSIAGPRVLEHMVDTVLYFEGDSHMSYRILRAVKNRFGSTNEIGIFEMADRGLAEVLNPSQMLLSGRMKGVSGSSVIASLEGTRPMLVEVQALLSYTSFGVPRRTATGADYNRVVLLMAVLEKRVGLQLQNYDSYVNVVGGIKLNEPSSDLGIIAAIASSYRDKEIDDGTVIIGEVGLAGEVRAVNFIEKRINEAAKLGFTKCVIPYNNYKNLKDDPKIKIYGVKSVEEALNIII